MASSRPDFLSEAQIIPKQIGRHGKQRLWHIQGHCGMPVFLKISSIFFIRDFNSFSIPRSDTCDGNNGTGLNFGWKINPSVYRVDIKYVANLRSRAANRVTTLSWSHVQFKQMDRVVFTRGLSKWLHSYVIFKIVATEVWRQPWINFQKKMSVRFWIIYYLIG